MGFDCDNCKLMRTGDCAGLTRSCQGFVPLQRVDPEILKAAKDAHDNRMHKENYYGSRNTQKRAEAVKQAGNARDQHEQHVKREPVRPVKTQENNAVTWPEREQLQARTERSRHAKQVERAPVSLGPKGEEVAAALRAWRKAQAQAENLPAYCVFPDTTLNALASAKIKNKADLHNVRGIGSKIYGKYGDDLFKILSEYN